MGGRRLTRVRLHGATVSRHDFDASENESRIGVVFWDLKNQTQNHLMPTGVNLDTAADFLRSGDCGLGDDLVRGRAVANRDRASDLSLLTPCTDFKACRLVAYRQFSNGHKAVCIDR